MKTITKYPLISICIPTFNSGKTIERTLDSIKSQIYKNYEIIIVDHYSTDETLSIAKKYTKKIYMDKNRLLSSRRIGFNKSKGDIILIVDSDHILEPTLLSKIAESFTKKDVDMLILEEKSWYPYKLVGKMYDWDRENFLEAYELDPCKSVLIPRVFKRKLMSQTFDRIDKELDNVIVVQDHVIMYYEAWQISKKIGLIKNALFHMDPTTFRKVFKHYYDCGKFQYLEKEAKGMIPKKYEDMFEGRMKNRLKSINWFSVKGWRSFPLIFTKGIGFKIGLFFYNNQTILKIKRMIYGNK